MDGDRFDELSRQIARAYVCDDHQTAQRLSREAVGAFAFPRCRRLVTFIAADPQLREESLAHALYRIADAWSRGREVRWAELERICRGAVSDIHKKLRRHSAETTPHLADADEHDNWIVTHAVGDSATVVGPDAEVGIDDRVLAIAQDLDQMGRPQLADLVRATMGGASSGPELGELLNISGGRVRQLRMELRGYLEASHPDLLESHPQYAQLGTES
jgi:hypothetical protein